MTAVLEHAARTARRSAQDEWREMAEAQYQAAETYTRGHMLSRRGTAAGIDPWRLWSGTQATADAYASHELKEFWSDWPRITITQFQRQEARAREAYRDELDRHAASAVRPLADERAQDHRDGAGHAFPGHDAARETQPERQRDPALAGRGAAVHRGGPGMRTSDEIRASVAARQMRSPAYQRVTARRAAAEASADDPGLPERVSVPPVAPAEVAVREPDAIMTGRGREAPDPAEMLGPLLEEIGLYLMDYVEFRGRAELVAAVIWIAHAAARDAERDLIWWASPRLLLTSALNGSGKSTLLDLIAILLMSRAGRMVKVTPYGLAKILGAYKEVGLPDDAQNVFGNSGEAGKELLNILLGSYSRGGTWVTGRSKCTIEPVYGAVAVAGKDDLITKNAEPLRDLLARSVILRFERPSRYMRQLDARGHARGRRLADALAAVTGALHAEMLAAAQALADEAVGGLITEGDGGRAAQIYRPLFAVARVAGGMWPAAIEQAAADLASASGDLVSAEDTLAELADVRTEGRSFWDEAGS